MLPSTFILLHELFCCFTYLNLPEKPISCLTACFHCDSMTHYLIMINMYAVNSTFSFQAIVISCNKNVHQFYNIIIKQQKRINTSFHFLTFMLEPWIETGHTSCHERVLDHKGEERAGCQPSFSVPPARRREVSHMLKLYWKDSTEIGLKMIVNSDFAVAASFKQLDCNSKQSFQNI